MSPLKIAVKHLVLNGIFILSSIHSISGHDHQINDSAILSSVFNSNLNILNELLNEGAQIVYVKDKGVQSYYRGAFYFFHYLFNYEFICCKDHFYELQNIKTRKIAHDIKILKKREKHLINRITYLKMCESLSGHFFRCQNDTIIYSEPRGF